VTPQTPDSPPPSETARLRETVAVFLRLGCTSFGGPVAHLGYFQDELVERRRWVSEAAFADVVALCQFLPGPASSQVALVLGSLRSGLFGGILGWMAFTAPSAVLMIAFAYGMQAIDLASAGWLHGLKVAAVAVVAQAIWLMGRKLCPDWPRFALMAAAAALLFVDRGAWLQPVVIAVGALIGRALLPITPETAAHENFAARVRISPALSNLCFALFFLLLGASLAWPVRNANPLDLFAAFYRTGSLVFGGGHVVLPLLQTETVRTDLVPHSVFLAGYGAAQALPGPLFTFAAFLGASMSTKTPWLTGLGCLFAILLPSLLLVVGVLPTWAKLAGNRHARAALQGANATVVGLLLAAFVGTVMPGGITSRAAAVMALVAFALLQFAKMPNWAIVLLCAAAGWLFL
jgi:chromate transporter